eukprot:gene27357-biopygen17841
MSRGGCSRSESS